MIVKYPGKLKEKIFVMKQDGASNLHIVSDFDKTLTKAFVQGGKIQSCYAKVRGAGYMGDEYEERGNLLVKYYYPFEIGNFSLDEKIKYMQEWWEQHYNLMVKFGFTQEMARKVVREFGIDFRVGTLEFFEVLKDNDVPLLILSAGIGDVVNEIFRVSDALRPNVHIISNFLIFDSFGKAIDYVRPLIHTFNKNEVAVIGTRYYEQIKSRKNVILLGDNIGDLGMSEGIEHDCIIKIGFLNDNVDDLKEEFSEKFDVVIEDDGPMTEVLDILSQILN